MKLMLGEGRRIGAGSVTFRNLCETDRRTDGPTDRRTEWVIESRARD